MYYVKYLGERLQIRADTVYNACPRCGRETRVDLDRVAAEMPEGESLLGSGVYCVACAVEVKKEAGRNE